MHNQGQVISVVRRWGGRSVSFWGTKWSGGNDTRIARMPNERATCFIIRQLFLVKTFRSTVLVAIVRLGKEEQAIA
jgi:hypothetical protein